MYAAYGSTQHFLDSDASPATAVAVVCSTSINANWLVVWHITRACPAFFGRAEPQGVEVFLRGAVRASPWHEKPSCTQIAA